MEAHILANAELVREVAREQLGKLVEYNEAGVAWLDEYIEGQRSGASEQVKQELPNTLGSFLGECIRQTFGGQWLQDGQTGLWGVKVSEKLTVFPFSKVQKQLANEEGDSVLGLFRSIGPLVQHPSTPDKDRSPTAEAPKRSWWRLW